MTRPRKAAFALLSLAFSAAIATRSEASGTSTYLSLGDSYAYGIDNQTGPASVGDQGYVSRYANYLKRAAGGVRPNVVNLGAPFESLGTFFSGGNVYAGANLNYTTPTTNQNGLLLQNIQSQVAAGNSIDHVTVALGTMDVMNLLNSPGFSSLTLPQQATALGTTLAQIQASYSALMGEVHALLPNAQVELIGGFNPFHAMPNNPLAPIAEPAFLGLNKIIQGAAASFGGTYIDTYSKFLGHEGTYTHVLGSPADINLTARGFAAIAASVEAASVPEPSTLFLAGLGLAALAGRARRRVARDA